MGGKKGTKQNFRNALKGFGLGHSSLEAISNWPKTERSSLPSSKNHTEVLHNPFLALSLTSHGAEPKLLVSIVVLSGSTPLHVVPASLGSAVGVVAVVVQEGEVAQSTIGIATTCLDQNCTKRKKKTDANAASHSLLACMEELGKQTTSTTFSHVCPVYNPQASFLGFN